MVTARMKYPFDPSFAVPPGETLAETIDSLGMSQKELATRTGMTEQSISRMLKGAQPITFETANKLELATGVPASFWNSLESNYREQLSKLAERDQLATELDWLKTIPVRELVARGVIPASKDKITLLRHTLAFYGVSSVKAWGTYWDEQAVAARRSQAIEGHQGATSAWIRLGDLQAQTIACAPYDKSRFMLALQEIRKLTTATPEGFVPNMRRLCADAGVALCLVPEMPKAPWHGASKWITPTKAMVLLGLRGKRDDQFWFSFFHEAGHVLHDSKKEMFINDGTKGDPREQRADEFAAAILVPPNRRDEVAALRSKAAVLALAEELGVAPGIVVGQFQHMTQNWDWFNSLKRKLVWADASEEATT